MDIRDLKFDDDTFDVAIDKGLCSSTCTFKDYAHHASLTLGTMDAMMTAKADVWVGNFVQTVLLSV